jgi:hypothetical protein
MTDRGPRPGWLVRVTLLAALSGMARSASADPPAWTPVPGEAPTSGHDVVLRASEGYCRYVRGLFDSERALNLWPSLFGYVGLVNPAELTGGASQTATPPSLRLTAGLSYSFAGLYRGGVLRDTAEADCATYRRFSELLAFIAHNKEGLSEDALLARARSLDEAVPEAEAKVNAAFTRAREGRGTVEEAHGLEARLDAIRLASMQARRDARAYAVTAASEDKLLRDLLAEYAVTETRAEQRHAALRQSYGWDVSVRGGYDQVFGSSTQYVPAYVMASASVNLGLLAAGRANRQAIDGRPIWSRWALEGGGHPAVDAVRRVRELGLQEADRIAVVSQKVAELEARERAAREIDNDKARLFADHIFFELVLDRAELAFLRAHVAHIRTLTAEQP